MKKKRYHVKRVADENCDRLDGDVLAETDDIFLARNLADKFAATAQFGAGILDSETGMIDVGFGFGVDAPDA